MIPQPLPNRSKTIHTCDPSLVRSDAIRRTDVLGGRGNGVLYHSGNIEFRSLIYAHAPAYRSAKDIQKKCAIVHMIWDHIGTIQGGRFLTPLDTHVGLYRYLSPGEVKQKIQQAFRDTKKRKFETSDGTKTKEGCNVPNFQNWVYSLLMYE